MLNRFEFGELICIFTFQRILASFSLVCVSTKRPRFASFAFWLSLFLHFYPFYSNFALYWFTGIVCTVSPPQAVVGRGAVVGLLSFQRTNPEDALLHCVQLCVVTKLQMVHRTTHCVEGPMSENQSRGCAVALCSTVCGYQSANGNSHNTLCKREPIQRMRSVAVYCDFAGLKSCVFFKAWKMRCVGLHRALLLFFSVWGHISKS